MAEIVEIVGSILTWKLLALSEGLSHGTKAVAEFIKAPQNINTLQVRR
jgi:hypothetical protein